jgi:PIN domain nuclease of toxin-antitoxin system
MKSFDGAQIIHGGGYLAPFGRETGSQSVADALHFQEISAVIGIDVEGLYAHAGNQIGRIHAADYGADTFGILGVSEL